MLQNLKQGFSEVKLFLRPGSTSEGFLWDWVLGKALCVVVSDE
jgi:hypothetical protein